MVPSTFRIARSLLSRIEDEAHRRVLLESCDVTIPDDRVEQARSTAAEIGRIADHYPFAGDAGPTSSDPFEQLLSRTWRAALEHHRRGRVAAHGDGRQRAAPEHDAASCRCASRPASIPSWWSTELRERLLADPPYGASVALGPIAAGPGWNAPPLAPWLEAALDSASTRSFGQPARMFGEGGSIPFMGMLGARFPEAQFVVTGVLGPDANAHGPNEYLHLPSARRITLAIAELLDSHARRS